MNNRSPQDPVSEIMKHSLVELPFSDFDQRMMMQIRREATAIAKSKKDKSLSSLFFALGCFSGICLSGLLVGYSGVVSYGEGMKTILQVFTILMVLLFLNTIHRRFTRSRSGTSH